MAGISTSGWTPKKSRCFACVGFAAVSLFGRGTWANLFAVALTVAAIALDALDGHLARKKQMATPLGAQLDVLGDPHDRERVLHLLCRCGMVSLWLPVLFFARGAATDFLRGLALKAGHSGCGREQHAANVVGTRAGASRWIADCTRR